MVSEVGSSSFAADWGQFAPDRQKVIERATACVGWNARHDEAVKLEAYAGTMNDAAWSSLLNLVLPMREMLGVRRIREGLAKKYPSTIAFLTAREEPAARAVATKKRDRATAAKAAKAAKAG